MNTVGLPPVYAPHRQNHRPGVALHPRLRQELAMPMSFYMTNKHMPLPPSGKLEITWWKVLMSWDSVIKVKHIRSRSKVTLVYCSLNHIESTVLLDGSIMSIVRYFCPLISINFHSDLIFSRLSLLLYPKIILNSHFYSHFQLFFHITCLILQILYTALFICEYSFLVSNIDHYDLYIF